VSSIATTPKRRATYHHGDLQSALISSAIDLVRIHGPAHLSLRAVAAEVGVSPSAVYHYFPDKDALVEGVSLILFGQLFGMQQEAVSVIPGSSAQSAKEKFRELGRSYFAWAKNDPNLFRLMFGGYCGTKQEEKVLEKSAFQMLVSALDDLVSSGVIDAKSRDGAEAFVWSSVHGATNLILEGAIPEESYETVLDRVELSLGIKK